MSLWQYIWFDLKCSANEWSIPSLVVAFTNVPIQFIQSSSSPSSSAAAAAAAALSSSSSPRIWSRISTSANGKTHKKKNEKSLRPVYTWSRWHPGECRRPWNVWRHPPGTSRSPPSRTRSCTGCSTIFLWKMQGCQSVSANATNLEWHGTATNYNKL